MKKQQKSMLMLAVMVAFMLVGFFMPSLIGAGPLEPTGPPAPTMHTLEEIYNELQAIKSKVNYNHCINYSGDRFCDVGDGTVLDTTTGLVWLKNANSFGKRSWHNATAIAATLADGQYGLTDGSQAGDWRLPTKGELQGLGTDPPTTWYDKYPPVTWTMPGSPFYGVQSDRYWSSTRFGPNGQYAYDLRPSDGYTYGYALHGGFYMWPVRSGN